MSKDLDKEELFDYIARFITNIKASDDNFYYISFKNDTPYLDCIEIDKDYYNRLKRFKQFQEEESWVTD